jgi:hypothetical protein
MTKIIKNSGISDKVANAIIEDLLDSNYSCFPMMDMCDDDFVEVDGEKIDYKYGLMNGDWNTIVVVVGDEMMKVNRTALYLEQNPKIECIDENGNTVEMDRNKLK